jgi:hypothetical protein
VTTGASSVRRRGRAKAAACRPQSSPGVSNGSMSSSGRPRRRSVGPSGPERVEAGADVALVVGAEAGVAAGRRLRAGRAGAGLDQRVVALEIGEAEELARAVGLAHPATAQAGRGRRRCGRSRAAPRRPCSRRADDEIVALDDVESRGSGSKAGSCRTTRMPGSTWRLSA